MTKKSKQASKQHQPVDGAKPHARTAKKSEEEIAVSRRRLAAAYLVQRDGLDEDLAATVVSGMPAEDLDALIVEANTSTIAQTKQSPRYQPDQQVTPANAGTQSVAEVVVATATALTSASALPAFEQMPLPDDPPDVTLFPELVAVPNLYALLADAAAATAAKNRHEADYKRLKAEVIALMKPAGVRAMLAFGWEVEGYTGHNSQLNRFMLLEAGCTADQIKRGYKDSPYEDIRIKWVGVTP